MLTNGIRINDLFFIILMMNVNLGEREHLNSSVCFPKGKKQILYTLF